MARPTKPHILVDPDWLVARLDDPGVGIIDCTLRRVPMPSGASSWESGRADWHDAHIPGASYVNMDTDLSDPNGQFPLAMPQPEAVWSVLSSLGVATGTTVVVYGAGAPSAVHRVWWVLMAAGVPDFRVLDGGWQRWLAEGCPVANGPEAITPADFRGKPRPHWFAGKADLINRLDDDAACLVHSLTEEQFLGAGGQVYGRPGRIPGSVNVPVTSVIDLGTGRFRGLSELQAVFDAARVDGHDPIITYCGGGIAASTTFLALTVLGYENVRLYDGSLLEWASDPDLPMEVG